MKQIRAASEANVQPHFLVAFGEYQLNEPVCSQSTLSLPPEDVFMR